MHKIVIIAIILLLIISPCLIKSNQLMRDKRIIGGKISPNEQWRFVAMVETKNPDGSWNECTGTIISSRHILTAAHCIIGFKIIKDTMADIQIIIQKEEIVVRINSQNINEISSLKLVKIQEAFIHYNYNTEVATNDLTILEAVEPFFSNIEPIKLSNYFDYEPGQSVLEMGFGDHFGKKYFTDEDPLIASEYLRQVQSYLHSIQTCREMWPFTISDTHLCVGSPNAGIGPGDSGGPLLIKGQDGNWYQIGVASFGENRPLSPELRAPVFMKIFKYCSWIMKITDGEAECHDMLPVPDFRREEMEMDSNEIFTTPQTPKISSITSSSETSEATTTQLILIENWILLFLSFLLLFFCGEN